jgi:dynein heavy chain
MNEFKTVNFPANGSVFDFYVDHHQQDFAPWVQKVPKFELDPDVPLQAVLVHTSGNHPFESFLNKVVRWSVNKNFF